MAEAFQSNFVFGLQGNQYQDFIEQMARPEIQKIIGIDDYEIIGFENHLSFQDFKETDDIVSHIYTAFLSDIKKENGKVSFKKKVCITLDERLCTDICPNTGRKITAIKLGGVELAYFIYFDIKEFFDFVYGKNINTKIETKEQLLPLHQRLGYNNQDELYSVLRSSKKLVALLESLGANIPTKQGKVDLIPAVSKDDKEFLELLNHKNPNVRDVVQAKLDMQFNRIQDNMNDNYVTAENIGRTNSHQGIIDSSMQQDDKKDAKQANNIDNELYLKYGFIHNIGYDKNNRKMAFVWTELESGMPLYYDHYLNLDDFYEGDFLELHFDPQRKYPKNIKLAHNQDEIIGLAKRFEGKLTILDSYAFINTEDEIAIFVKPKLAKQIGKLDDMLVECVATFDIEKGWRAELVYELD